MSAGPVLDSSALLALILEEPGAELVRSRLPASHVSTVTLAETIEVLTRKGDTYEGALARMRRALQNVEPFTREQAEAAALLLSKHRRSGLSFGDAACLALALQFQSEALTGDRFWTTLGLTVPVSLIR